MSHRLILLLVLLAGIVLSPRPAAAQSRGIYLHIVPAATTNCALSLPPDLGSPFNVRTDALSTPAGPFYFVYLIGLGRDADSLGGLSTIGGIECGINYPGGYAPSGGARPISVFGWTLCGDLNFNSPDWPAPGSGTLVTWSAARCAGHQHLLGQRTAAIAGYFYLGAYAPAQLRVTPRPASGRANLARCNGREFDVTPNQLCSLGVAGFAMWGNDGSCPLPVRNTSWGGIKALYGN